MGCGDGNSEDDSDVLGEVLISAKQTDTVNRDFTALVCRSLIYFHVCLTLGLPSCGSREEPCFLALCLFCSG